VFVFSLVFVVWDFVFLHVETTKSVSLA